MGTRNLIKNILTGISLFLIGCSNPTEPREFNIEWDMRLPQDENGYYHLTLNRDTWQTTHRVSAIVTEESEPVEFYNVAWESNLYWVLGDTLGYVVNRYISDFYGTYVNVDTTYIIGFSGELVRTTNWHSMSNSDGEINNMIAPVRSMIGDTLKLYAIADYDHMYEFEIVLD
jgi:hypothetical protein|tara:strand:+ start:4543 stop:5058 length:516 start_codon:yes stop_codon:yes gene_type:complete